MKFYTIKIAGINIRIGIRFFRTYNMCRDFFSNETADNTVYCNIEDYDREAAVIQTETCNAGPSDVFLEPSALLRKIADHLINYNVLLMHGAAIAVGEEAYVFIAPSGTGKTTHILKWLENCPDSIVVNGDKTFISINDNETSSINVYGSPWAGKESLYTNTKVPLKAIIIMERNSDNCIWQISFAEAFPTILQQVYRSEDEKKMRKTLKAIQKLNGRVDFWRFRCNNLKPDCFHVAYSALTGKNNTQSNAL